MIVLAERLVLSLSSVRGQFRSVFCSLLEVRVLLVKLKRSVRSLFVGMTPGCLQYIKTLKAPASLRNQKLLCHRPHTATKKEHLILRVNCKFDQFLWTDFTK